MKKIVSLVLALTFLLALAACGGQTAPTTPADTAPVMEGDSIGAAYVNAFAASQTGNASDAADELIALGAFDTSLEKMEVSEGWLNGFTEDITGFSKGYMFSPLIGAIPFVGYVFESSDPAALEALLLEKSDMGWNICTVADETVSYVRGNLVLFLMCSNDSE